MKKIQKSKLSVQTTTVRNLSTSELANIQGGGSHASCIQATCTCPPTYNGCGGTLTGQFCV